MSTVSPESATDLGPREVLARYRRAMLDKNADDLAALYAVDAIHEFPFLFPGVPARYHGREEVRTGYKAAWAASPARPRQVHEVAVHDSTDPEVITVEQSISGTVITTGEAFEFPALLVMRVQHGLIAHIRDYVDGLAVAHALGRLPTVAAMLGGHLPGSPTG